MGSWEGFGRQGGRSGGHGGGIKGRGAGVTDHGARGRRGEGFQGAWGEGEGGGFEIHGSRTKGQKWGWCKRRRKGGVIWAEMA